MLDGAEEVSHALIDRRWPDSAVGLVDAIITDAANRGVSDIHIQPELGSIRARMRIDGLLEEVMEFPASLHPAVLSRIKILAGLRTDEHFAAQDGRFRFSTGNDVTIDVRVSIAPTYHGENAVLRLLSNQQRVTTLQSLGCRKSHQRMLARSLEKPYGMILATGPTGSGKTTLLYTLLQMLDSRTSSIVTLEDPIEYSLPGINQIPVSSDRGLTFPTVLRSVLRQDPDVIMVGEIRDEETARLATNAALTGHLVLSTLHTNDAPSALVRMFDLSIEPYMLASTIELVVAQRLVRRICQSCITEATPRERTLELARDDGRSKISGNDIFFTGSGCGDCNGRGYSGRTGVFEVLLIDEVVREALLTRAGIKRIRSLAIERGMVTMTQDGLQKARKGIVPIEEVARITYG